MKSIEEIKEIPVIINDKGEIEIFSMDLVYLTTALQNKVAMMLEGTIAYVKVRATYEIIETKLCYYKDCYRVSQRERIYCSDHQR